MDGWMVGGRVRGRRQASVVPGGLLVARQKESLDDRIVEAW